MKITNRKTIFDGKFVRIVVKDFSTAAGKTGTWEVVERKNCHKRIVIIFALTKNREVVLEKNFRVPCESYVLELPAGITDKEGESEEDAARRELLEETGFVAKDMIPVFYTVASPGLLNSEFVYFFAPEAELKGIAEGDGLEEIEVVLVPLDNLVNFLLSSMQGKDVKVDDKILNLLPILQKKNLI